MRGGAALCFLLLVPALAVFAGQRWFTERRGGSFVTVTGKVGAATRVKSLSPAAVLGLAVVCGLVVALVLVCYLLIFAASIVRGLGADNSLSLAHYGHVFSGGLKAVRGTLIVAVICMPVGGLFAVVLGFLVSRTRFPGRRALEFAAMMNYALPGTIVGIAYLVAFNDPPLALTGTAFILVVCYVFRYSLAGTRATSAVLAQIDPSIEEASASLGARRDVTFRRVVLPLIRPALLAGMTVLFIRAMTAISATIFLVSLSWSLVTVRILEGITNLELGQASAFSMLVILLVYAAVAVAGPAPPGLRDRRLRAARAAAAGGDDPRARRPRAGARRVARLRAPLSEPALGRRAAARGRRASRRRGAGPPALRRAAVEPRRQAPGPDARRAVAPAAPAGDHHRLRDARPGGGHGHLGPHRRDARGLDRPGRHRGGALSRAMLHLRRAVHRPREPRGEPRARPHRWPRRRRAVGCVAPRAGRPRLRDGPATLAPVAPGVADARARVGEGRRGRGGRARRRARPDLPGREGRVRRGGGRRPAPGGDVRSHAPRRRGDRRARRRDVRRGGGAAAGGRAMMRLLATMTLAVATTG